MGLFSSNNSSSKVASKNSDGRQEIGGGAIGFTNPDKSAIGLNAPAFNLSGKNSSVGDVFIQDISGDVVKSSLASQRSVISDAFRLLQFGLTQSNDAIQGAAEFSNDALRQGFAAGKSADERSAGRLMVLAGVAIVAALFSGKVKF